MSFFDKFFRKKEKSFEEIKEDFFKEVDTHSIFDSINISNDKSEIEIQIIKYLSLYIFNFVDSVYFEKGSKDKIICNENKVEINPENCVFCLQIESFEFVKSNKSINCVIILSVGNIYEFKDKLYIGSNKIEDLLWKLSYEFTFGLFIAYLRCERGFKIINPQYQSHYFIDHAYERSNASGSIIINNSKLTNPIEEDYFIKLILPKIEEEKKDLIQSKYIHIFVEIFFENGIVKSIFCSKFGYQWKDGENLISKRVYSLKPSLENFYLKQHIIFRISKPFRF